MATPIPNRFTSFLMTAEEVTEGSKLTITQQQCIQNQIATLAEMQLALEYDHTNPVLFAQQHADYAGGIKALGYLLTLNDVACNPQTVED